MKTNTQKNRVNASEFSAFDKNIVKCPCIHASGSVAGMRRDFWGYKCDVVRVGQWIYKAN